MAVSMSIGHFPVGSKLLQKKWNERQLKTHKTKIASMKADVDNKNPLVHAHLRLKLKKVQLEEEFQATVDNENKVLVDRISRIMRDRGRLDNWNETYKPRSLNRYHRSSVAAKIQGENQLLVKRLNAIKPLYDIRKWENDYNFHEYVLQNMRSTTKDYETTPNIRSHRPRSPFQEERIRLPSVDPRNGMKAGSEQLPRKQTKLPNVSSKSEQNPRKIQDATDPSKDATVLHNFCKDEEEEPDYGVLSRCLAQRRFRERMHLQEEYEKLYDGERLLDSLKEQTHSSFRHVLTALLSRRETYDALTLRDALVDAPRKGARESTLIEIICTRHDLALQAIKKDYFNKYNSQLSSDIARVTNGQLQIFLLTLLSRERSSDIQVDQQLAARDANELLKNYSHLNGYQSFEMDVDDRWRVDDRSGHFFKMLDKEGYAQIRAAFVEYERITGMDVFTSVFGAMDEEDDENVEYWNAVVAFVKCLRNCPSFFAESMRNSLLLIEKQGSYENSLEANTSWAEKTLIRCIITRCEADLPQILRVFRKKYGISLQSDIETRCELLYRDLLLDIIKNQEQLKKRRHGRDQRVAGMIIRGPPNTNALVRPPLTRCSPERLQKSPLNKSKSKPSNLLTAALRRSNENRRTVGKKRARHLVQDSSTVQPARDFSAEKETDLITSALKTWGKRIQPNPNFNVEVRAEYTAAIYHLQGLSNDQRQKLRIAYATRHKRDLVTDLEQAVEDEQYAKLLSEWMKTKVEADTTALHNALMNENEEKVALEILCCRPNKHVKNVTDVYRRFYGSTVTETINEKVKDGYWQRILSSLAQADRDITNNVISSLATSNATSLYEDEISGLDSSKCLQIFTKNNFAQIRATLNAFKKISGKELQDVIKNSPDGDEEKKKATDAIVRCCRDPAAYFCDELRKSLVQEEMDLKSVCRILVSRAETDLETIKQLYLEAYGTAVKNDIESKSKEIYVEFLLALLSPSTLTKR